MARGNTSTPTRGDRSINEVDQGDFADQTTNKSCTILVEVTNACNLACPVCYSDARGDRKMPLPVFKDYLLRLIESKGPLDSVQLTGGVMGTGCRPWARHSQLPAVADNVPDGASSRDRNGSC